MARRSRRTGATTGRGRPKPPPDYYAHSESDLRYAKGVDGRLRTRTRRTWLIRLAVLAVLVLIGRLWGPMVVRVVRGQGRQTVDEFKGVGQHIQEGRDRRSGADFDENAP